MFFDFFQTKQHLKLESFSLVPKKGETGLLLINSGMAPMKDWFLGVEKPPSKRVVTCQKCVRTVDLQNVGKTDRHGTFFEMLGNFSFGDYFKREAIAFAWEFVTQKLKLPKDRLYVTVYEKDDEAKLIWEKEQGVDPSHLVKLGKDDNFWEIGKGPCGPCSELYFDRGEKFGCGKQNCGPGCDCDRFVEFWNLVFSQYCSDGEGNYENLVQKNIDTGMGLERLACIVQGVNNLFEVDSIKKVLLDVSRLAGVVYGDDGKTDVLIRIIVDHIRSSVFLIADGVIPSNEGRGYVLRRLIRRILTSAKVLQMKGQFLKILARVVISENSKSYKNLAEQEDYVCQVLNLEENSFSKILVKGKQLFDELVVRMKKAGLKKVCASEAFKLCDTFGMPFYLLSDLAMQHGFEVDEPGFLKLLNEQKTRAKVDALKKAKGWQSSNFLKVNFSSEFVGYEKLECKTRLKAIFFKGKQVDVASKVAGSKNEEYDLFFNETPFYVQSGGQVGDWGFVNTSDGLTVAEVVDCKRLENGAICHRVVVIYDGVSLKQGDVFCLEVEKSHRLRVSKNHTAAHILHQALINVLGAHVHQAGQLVDAERLRFDFSHFEALKESQLMKIEREVNKVIWNCFEVKTSVMPLDEAKKLGAKALFDEKYGEMVRVVEVGQFSRELCGGTHVKNTGELGVFKIVLETSVGAGVRRIEACVADAALAYFDRLQKHSGLICSRLKVKDEKLALERIEQLQAGLKGSEAELNELKLQISKNLFENCLKINYFQKYGLNFATFRSNLLAGKLLKTFAEDLIQLDENLLLLIFSEVEDKFVFLVGCAKKAVKAGCSAGKMVQQLAEAVNSKGGGRASIAMAGVRDGADFEVVESKFDEIVNGILESKEG